SKMRDNSGQQWTWGYQYNTAVFSISTHQPRRTRGFGNLALYDQPVRYDQYQEPIITLSRSSAHIKRQRILGAGAA
ncbi:hypothetical protein, partial [Cronobacter sakazakii]|uniref:hypothetical protein n=1 Tax=Cronobacter sakazakii TaxID=28141 RepID=UPI003C2F501C